ncbi:MAG TPA: hypothetical protein VGO93_25975 [Candidatus Xenobia bacterium]|jgi:hypothetical protein
MQALRAGRELLLGRNPEVDPPERHGVVYRLEENGDVAVLSGQVPARDNRVVLAVEGLWRSMADYRQQWQTVLHDEKGRWGNVRQPIVGVHEGNHERRGRDVLRLVQDLSFMKLLQWQPRRVWRVEAAYRRDPSVRKVHDIVLDAVRQGQQVLLVTHSAGGAQAALALTILAAEGHRVAVTQHVRVLALANAVSAQSYFKAGVAKENLFYTADKRDPVGSMAKMLTVDWGRPWASVREAGKHMRHALQTIGGEWHHDLVRVFYAHREQGSTPAIQRFIDGGPGKIAF